MVAFQIREVKNFMARLFQKEEFDHFAVREGQVQMAAGFQFNGHRSHNFYTEEELNALSEPDFLLWGELKSLVFAMIRGAKRWRKYSKRREQGLREKRLREPI